MRDESALMSRLGRDRALALLFDRYPRGAALAAGLPAGRDRTATRRWPRRPTGAARIFWEAAYPRAFPELVGQLRPARGQPRPVPAAPSCARSRRFLPTEVSYADARGLLQLLPATGAKLAAELEMPFSAEQLFVPEINVRLGARYLGGLASKFRGNIALAAGRLQRRGAGR